MDLQKDLNNSSVAFVVGVEVIEIVEDAEFDFGKIPSYSFVGVAVVAAAASFAVGVGVAAAAVPVRPSAHLLEVLCC